MVRKALRLLLAAWALMCSGPLVLHAQDAPHRTQLKDLCEALDSATSVARVELIKARWDAPTGNPVERLGDAYAELRLGALTNERNIVITAWDHFDQTVREHPDWPYARLGLAKAALEVYSRGYALPASYDDVAGGSHYDGYVIEMKHLLKEEPNFEPVITWLTETLSAEGDREQPGAILELLQYAADSAGNDNPQIQLILARAERLEGQVALSVRRMDAYLREGGDSGIGDLEMAHSLAWMGELENAAIEYLAGAQVQSSAARANYRRDLSWVATPRELARYDSLPADSVGTWIGHFWGKRDVQELRPDGSRLQEHLRRWVYVSQHFRVPDPGRRTAYKEVFIPPTDANGLPLPCLEDGPRSLDDYDYTEPARQGGYRALERVFDHRAIVYMRHGEPTYKFGGAPDSLDYGPPNGDKRRFEDSYVDLPTPTQIGADPSFKEILWKPDATHTVTWAYVIGGQFRVFTFMGYMALGRNSPSTMILYQPPSLDVLQRLAALSSSYARLAGATQVNAYSSNNVTPSPCERSYREVVRQQRSDAAVAITTDTYLRRFAKPIEASLQISALGQPSASTGELLAAIAVRTQALVAEPVPGDTNAVQYQVRLQLAAIDSLTGEAVRADTIRTIRAARQSTQTNAWITVLTTLRLRPGLKEVRLSVEQDDDRGSVFAADISPAGAGFAISDMVLGTEQGSLNWRRNGMTVLVTAFNTFTVGETVPLYYELYGLTSGARYRTRLTLQRTGDNRIASTVSFTDNATSSTVASSRSLTLNNVKPGQYELIVTVDEVATGRRVVRQRAISVDKGPSSDTR